MPQVTYKDAQRRYLWAFAPVMTFYCVFCFVGPALLTAIDEPPKWAVALIAIVTGAPIAIVFWLIGRHLRETDEYTRKIQSEAMLAGGGVALSAATVWAFLELFDVVPRFEHFPSMMMVGPAFFAAWGVASYLQRLRNK
jgi:hypothetical protein